jgi:hypothetical protein
MTPNERMADLGARTMRLPRDVCHRITRAYVDLAGGWSWDANAHPLTDAEIDKLEKMIIEAEQTPATDRDVG